MIPPSYARTQNLADRYISMASRKGFTNPYDIAMLSETVLAKRNAAFGNDQCSVRRASIASVVNTLIQADADCS